MWLQGKDFLLTDTAVCAGPVRYACNHHGVVPQQVQHRATGAGGGSEAPSKAAGNVRGSGTATASPDFGNSECLCYRPEAKREAREEAADHSGSGRIQALHISGGRTRSTHSAGFATGKRAAKQSRCWEDDALHGESQLSGQGAGAVEEESTGGRGSHTSHITYVFQHASSTDSATGAAAEEDKS